MKSNLNQSDDETIKSLETCRDYTETGKYFKNGNEMYHQLLGTATGLKFSSTYVNLLKAGIERKTFQYSGCSPNLWLSYLGLHSENF